MLLQREQKFPILPMPDVGFGSGVSYPWWRTGRTEWEWSRASAAWAHSLVRAPELQSSVFICPLLREGVGTLGTFSVGSQRDSSLAEASLFAWSCAQGQCLSQEQGASPGLVQQSPGKGRYRPSRFWVWFCALTNGILLTKRGRFQKGNYSYPTTFWLLPPQKRAKLSQRCCPLC